MPNPAEFTLHSVLIAKADQNLLWTKAHKMLQDTMYMTYFFFIGPPGLEIVKTSLLWHHVKVFCS